jgi:RHS repeat-associated protein
MNKGTFIAMVLGVCVFGTVAKTTAQTTDSTQQILQQQRFADGLVLTGSRQPTEAENAALLSVLNQMNTPTWTTNLEKFLSAHPSSPWTASLRHNYAQLCRQAGRTTKALEQWEAAWPLLKADASPAGHKLAGTILANWMEQLASLGRYEKLQELSAAGDAMNFSNPADRDKFQAAKGSWLMMAAHPGMAFRCGTFALKAVGGVLRPGDRELQQLVGIQSPTNGFSMAQLVELSRQYHLDLTAVKRTAGQELIVPSVVHWRQNHYAAILERQENLYRVSDPTFGNERWLTAATINEEAGGEFLIPASAVTGGWQSLATNETELVRGMGLSFHIKDANDKSCPTCKACQNPHGMPVWWVSEPYINLWMADEPISYLTSSGEPFTFRLSYKQRDTRPASGLMRPTGWNNSWSSYISLQGTTPCLGGASSCGANLSGSYATVYLPDGGTVSFAPGQTYDSETHLTIKQQGVTMNNGPDTGLNGLRLIYPDGSQDIYGFGIVPAAFNFYPNGNFVRSRHIDADGNTTWFYYKYSPNFQVLLLSAVIDPDGRTNTLVYNSANLLAEVDNPYGLKAFFKYDANGNLTNLVDAQGLSSRITYDTNNYPTALITPYGTNTFVVTENVNWQTSGNNLGGHGIDRAIRVTDPIGATSLWMYRDDCSTFMAANIPASDVPTGTPLNTLDTGGAAFPAGFCFLNSFYWGPRQLAGLTITNLTSFTGTEYSRGRMQHWLADSNLLNVTGYLSVQREPSPDGSSEGLKTFYDYQGKYPNFNSSEGTNALPSVVAWRIPNGESHWQWTRFDAFGNETNRVETCTLPDGTLGTRTNQFIYADNTYSYVFGVWNGSGMINTTGNSYTLRNLLTQIIAADGQPVWTAGNFDTVVWTNWYYASTQTNASTLTSLRVRPSIITNGVGQTATATWSGGTLITNYTVVSTNVPVFGKSFTGFGQITSFKSYSGLTTTNLFNTDRFLTQTIDLEIGRTNSFSYTSNGLVGTFTNELGLNVSILWDNLLRPVSAQFPDGTYTSNRFVNLDLAGRRDRLGNWTTFGHDGARHLTAVTNANNAVTTLNWCGCGALESILDALTNLTVLNHDNAGRLIGYNFPDNSSLTFKLDLAGRTTNVADGAGRGFTLALNHQGLPTSITDALNHSLRRTTFDLRDRPVTITDANSITLTNIFDPLNRLLSRVWPDNIAESLGYSERGLVAYTNRDGKVTLYGLDVAGRRTSVTNANQEVTRFGYNPANKIISLIDGLQHQRTWQRSEYGRTTNKLDGLNRTVFRQQFNPNGWLTNRWTPEKGNIAYVRDSVGNVTNIFYAAQNLSLLYGFDPLNRLTSMNDLFGFTRFTRDPMGRIVTESNAWTTVGRSYANRLRTKLTIGTNWTQTYAFDLGRRLTNATSMAGGFIYRFLDSNYRRPAAILIPNGAVITNVFDSLARLKSTALQDHWRHTLDGYTYTLDALGLRTNVIRDLGLTTNSADVGYDNINQILSWNAKESDGTPRLNEQLGFGYDAANNLHTRANGALTQTFSTDAADQLASVSRNGAFTLSGATPAPALNVTVNGQTAQIYKDFAFARTNLTLTNGANTFTVIATNMYGVKVTNIVSVNLPVNVGFGYDNNGNLTNDGAKSFAFDAGNQLTNVTVANNFKKDFVYDGLKRLRIKREYGWIGGTWKITNEIRFVWDGNVIVQLRNSNNVPTLTLTRGLGLRGGSRVAGGIGGLLAMTDGGGNSLYYHADGSGNITALMDGRENIVGRREYGAFGQSVFLGGRQAGANPFWYSSQLFDEDTRLVHFKRRAYSPELSRFLNNDPIGERGGRNLARFARNNPLRYVDELGLFGGDPESLPSQNGSQVNSVPFMKVTFPGNCPGGGKPIITNNDSPEELGMMIGAAGALMAGAALALGLDGPDELAAGEAMEGSGAAVEDGATAGADTAEGETATDADAAEGEEAAPENPKCFAAGTLVATPNGKVNIENIKIGDAVYAYDFDSKKVVASKVSNTSKNYTYHWVKIEVGNETLLATRNHPFWVENEQHWAKAVSLKAGVSVRLLDGEIATITSISSEDFQQSVTTYNLIVERLHNYYVGKNSVLVHNGSGNGRGGWGSGLPTKGGPPNGSLSNGGLEPDGTPGGTIRDYDVNGNAETDYDFGHDYHGTGDPHAHDWNNGVRDPKSRPIGPCD